LISSFIKSNLKSNRALSRLNKHPFLWIDKMPVKDKPTTPRFRPFNNIFLILGVIFLVANFIVPSIVGPQVPAVPYSLFIHQVQEGQVDRVQIAANPNSVSAQARRFTRFGWGRGVRLPGIVHHADF
jgi:hypothetical protein